MLHKVLCNYCIKVQICLKFEDFSMIIEEVRGIKRLQKFPWGAVAPKVPLQYIPICIIH